MGGANWLRDDSAANGECHLIKWIHTAPVYYAGVQASDLLGRLARVVVQEWGADMCKQARTEAPSEWTCLLPGALQPDLHLASGFCACVFVRLCSHSVLLQ